MPRPVNTDVLKSIAASSGGQFFETLHELNGALSALELTSIEEQTAKFQTLWRTWPVVGLLMLLLAASWGLRKAKNIP